jgi:outer membrane protein assembly factor BamB
MLDVAWTYSPGGVIWSLRSTPAGMIVGEERDQEKREARFFCLNGMTGEVVWERLTLSQPWWTGIDAIHESVIFFHDFAKPDLPEHAHIHAVDLMTGKHLWSNTEVSFWFAYKEKVYGTRMNFESRSASAFDVRTGALIEEHPGDISALNPLRRLAETPPMRLIRRSS